MLILGVGLASPPAAVAQPAAESVKPTEVSELIVEARRATAVSGVVSEGCAIPADKEGYRARASRPAANRQYDAPPRPNKRTEESPGTRAFILRSIADFRNGTADFEHMSDSLARSTRRNLPLAKRWIVCRGALKDVRFLHVSEAGYDDFEVEFPNSVIEWEVKPLNSRQVTDHWAARFYYPEPATKRFNETLESMERGRPTFDRLAPDFAPALQARWPTLKQAFRKWRGPHSIVFLRHEDDGSYAYKVAYGDHVVFWTVAPLDAAGRITGLTYEEGA